MHNSVLHINRVHITNYTWNWTIFQNYFILFVSSAIYTAARNYWRRLICLQFTTCDHEISSSRECFGTVFVLLIMVNTSSQVQRNAA